MIVRAVVVLAVLVSGLVAPPAHAAPARSAGASAGASASAAAKPRALVAGTVRVLGSGKVRVSVTSNAKKVKVAYRTAKNKKRTATITIRKGKGARTLARGSKAIRAQAKATKKLKASAWITVGGVSAAPAVAGGTYTVGPDSAILPPMSGYSTVNQYTRHYYLIRSYMHRFESAGGGTLILGPGRYEISSTIYVPSNTTIQLSAGTTLVKSNTTGTSSFSASASMFMLIRPSLGKVSGAVGGHDGDATITIAGAGGGSSVIDLAGLRDTLAIISGHNRGVTISGITFRRMNNNHFIEMDGCADCTIAGNEFLDAAGGTRETAEAINLDTPDPKTGGFSSVWSKQDATPNERVTIAGNRFDGMQRALGTHNFSAGRYHTDIVVRDNTITSNANDAIHIMNWTNPVFAGNTITSRGGSAGIRACGTSNPTITANTFAESGTAVVFRSCSGENGTTRANAVTADNVTALRANLVGAGLGSASVTVPEHGTVWFNGHEPPPTVPSQPYVGMVVPGDGQASVRWSPGYTDPRAPITGYRVRVYTTLSGTPVQTLDSPADATGTVLTGLTNGTTYSVTVAAMNSVGESYPGYGMSFTPIGPPTAPTNPTAVSTTSGAVTLTWAVPTSTGGRPITSYRIYGFTDPAATTALPGSPVTVGPTTTHTWTGLTDGATVHFRITALNEVGESPPTALVPVVVKATAGP